MEEDNNNGQQRWEPLTTYTWNTGIENQPPCPNYQPDDGGTKRVGCPKN